MVNGTIEYINNVNIAFNSTVVRKSNHFNFLHIDKKTFFASQLNGFFILIGLKKKTSWFEQWLNGTSLKAYSEQPCAEFYKNIQLSSIGN